MPTFDAAAPARTAISGYRPVAMTHDRKRTAYHPPAADRRAMDATQTADHHQIFDEKKKSNQPRKTITAKPFPPGQRPTHSYPDQSRKKPYDKERANRLRFANGGCVVRGVGRRTEKKKVWPIFRQKEKCTVNARRRHAATSSGSWTRRDALRPLFFPFFAASRGRLKIITIRRGLRSGKRGWATDVAGGQIHCVNLFF